MFNTLPTRVTALLFALVCTLGLLGPAQPAAAAPVAWPEDGDVTVADGLNLPWGMVQLDDGSLLVTSSDSGEIIHVSGVGKRRVAGTVPNIQPLNEGGLLGLVRDPADPGVLFAYASSVASAGNENRIWRLTWDGIRVSPDRVILDRIPHGAIHSGGQLKFGPDGFLYVTTGDTSDRATSQDLGTMAGKILRIDRNGAAAPGNPFTRRPGANARIWSYGHRNVQGIGWDGSGRMWASEFGESAWDELNRIEPGRNYGWPICEGRFRSGSTEACTDPALTNPVRQWRPADASPSSLTVVGDTVLIAALRGQSVWSVPVNGRAPVRHLHGDYGRIRSLLPTADGRLFVATSNGNNSDRIVLVDAGPMVPDTHPIDWRYAAIGAGVLGIEDGGPWCGLSDGGCFSRFQNGSIYWSPTTGAHFTRGVIRAEWGSLGWETGFLGYPVSDEICGLTRGGCYQQFQGGTMYWSFPTGAHFTRGAIRARWGQTGWERGVLGYPTSHEFCGLRDRGCFQTFQNGSVYWSPASGAHPVRGALRDIWARSGWENGRWGYPTSEEACTPGHCWQSFQGGVMHVRW